jgi:hypothetical protein
MKKVLLQIASLAIAVAGVAVAEVDDRIFLDKISYLLYHFQADSSSIL